MSSNTSLPENLRRFPRAPTKDLWSRMLSARNTFIQAANIAKLFDKPTNLELEDKVEEHAEEFVITWLAARGYKDPDSNNFLTFWDLLYQRILLILEAPVEPEKLRTIVDMSRRSALALKLRKTPTGAIPSDLQKELIDLLEKDVRNMNYQINNGVETK